MAEESVLPSPLGDRYRVLSRLGEGGMGAVFLAEDRELRRQVALKLCLPGIPAEASRRFLREAQVMAGLRHPNIVEVYEAGMAEGQPYLVMEYLEGTSLDRSLDRVDAVEAMLQVAGALEVVHGQGLIHRDVKPGNVMVAEDGRVALGDFGLALDPGRTALTATGALVGTVAYLPQEVLQSGLPTPEADWYAWGVSLYRLLEGQLPWTPQEVIQAVQGELPALRFRRLSPDSKLAGVIRRCLDPNPRRRPSCRRQLEELLEPRVADQVAVAGADDGAASRGGPPVAKLAPDQDGVRRRAAWLAGVGLVGALWWVLASPGELVSPGVSPDGPGGGRGQPAASTRVPIALGEDLPRRLADQIERAKLAFRDPGGEVLFPEGEFEPGRSRPLLDPDPVGWPVALEQLDAIRRLRAWVGAGGLPEDLPEAFRARLEVLDGRLAAELGHRPLSPWIRLGPSEKVEGLLPGQEASPGIPARVRGWRATLRSQLRLAIETSDRASRGLENCPRGDCPEDMPEEVRAVLQGFLYKVPGLERRVKDMFRWEAPRAWWCRWEQVGLEAMRGLLYAAGRAMEEAPEQADGIFLEIHDLRDRTGSVWYQGEGMLASLELLGPPRDHPAWWALAAYHLQRCRGVIGRVSQANEDLDGVLLEAWNRAVAGQVSDLAASRRLDVMLGRYLLWRHQGAADFQAVRELWGRFRQVVLDSPPGLILARAKFLQVEGQAQGAFVLDPADRDRLKRDLDAARDQLDPAQREWLERVLLAVP